MRCLISNKSSHFNGSVNRFFHLSPVGILPTLASTKRFQGGGLDPLLSANNIGSLSTFFLYRKLTSHVNFSNFQAEGNFFIIKIFETSR